MLNCTRKIISSIRSRLRGQEDRQWNSNEPRDLELRVTITKKPVAVRTDVTDNEANNASGRLAAKTERR